MTSGDFYICALLLWLIAMKQREGGNTKMAVVVLLAAVVNATAGILTTLGGLGD